jgi:hypothetical protein
MSISTNYGNVLFEIQMNPDEIAYMTSIIKNLPDNALMVEWGAGASTCKWLETLNDSQSLITVEHTDEWYVNVKKAVDVHFGDVSKNFTFLYCPEAKGFQHRYASIEEENPVGLKSYIYPDIPCFFDADLFFIDGVARSTCALAIALKRTKHNAFIFIHDYVGREQWYECITSFFVVEKVGTTLVRLHLKD